MTTEEDWRDDKLDKLACADDLEDVKILVGDMIRDIYTFLDGGFEE